MVGPELENITAQLSAFLETSHNEDGTLKTADVITGILPVGGLTMWTGATVPTGWLKCDGSAVSRNTYNALFSVISTTYGAGDGVLTFNLPNLQQRFPIGSGLSVGGLGSTGGAFNHTHTGPSHTHGLTGASAAAGGDHNHGGSTGSESSHTHTFSATTGLSNSNTIAQAGASDNFAKADHTHDVSGTTDAGSSHSHSIGSSGTHTHSISGSTDASGTGATSGANPPYLAIDFIIFAGV